MDAGAIEAITALGFNGLLPSALCIYLIISGSKREERSLKAIEDLRKTVENNTVAITKLVARIGGSYDD